MKNVTCLNCGWVSMAVSREYAENEVKEFNEYFATLTKKEQEDLYGGKGSSIKFYEECIRCCGSYQNFKDSEEGDCPIGCTINPVIESND